MADPGPLRMVLFRLGPKLWAVPAGAVREVIAPERPTRIPGTDQAVAGLVNLRGTLLTVVDGRLALERDADTETAPGAILVVERNGRGYGLGIDEVLDLVDVRPEDLMRVAPPEGTAIRGVQAQGRHGGRTFAVLDIEAVFEPVLD
ncbi:MAG TPA: chemotaxis protein CheW [Gemmatimonadales bacterium]|nr:chemotaxis protein CheW [Gemmatimonadales bacterium]